MRNRLVLAALLLLSTMVVAKDQTLDALKARAQSSSARDCPKACMDYARAAAEESNRKFTDGDVENAQKLMADAASFAVKAGETSLSERKHQKQTEIALRKFVVRVADIKNSLAVEDRPPLAKQIQNIDAVRERLLSTMFGNPPSSLDKPK